ncbi:MAG: ORF6N domain-containing protein [Verrucomicrobiota bacterium]|nr:ORF6N domain-containing protein [Verrucomicrobiota bacterium]
MATLVLKPEHLARFVFFIRGEKIMLDADLARLYGVTTKTLNQAMRRNAERFPEDFAFRLSQAELQGLRSQIVTSSDSSTGDWSQIVTSSQRHRRRDAPPYAFTEQGVAMLSSVLRSARAVEVNIAIMRTFVQLRRLMDSNRELARKIEGLEKKYDEQFAVVFAAIKELITPPAKSRKQIGFHP